MATVMLVAVLLSASSCISGQAKVADNEKMLVKDTFKGKSYGSTGSGHWVKAKIDNGKHVILEDGSLWQINRFYRIYTRLWLPLTSITVIENPGGLCPYKLLNEFDEQSVEATFIGRR